jgi:cytoskeletal protein RodZ
VIRLRHRPRREARRPVKRSEWVMMTISLIAVAALGLTAALG